MSYVVRPYKSVDIDALKNCIWALKKFESQFDIDYLVSEDSVENLLEGILGAVNEGRGEIFVAENDESKQVIGFVSVERSIKNEPEIVSKVEALYVSDLVVLPEERSNGVGKILLDRVEEYAKELGIKYLKLIVFANSDRVREFYDRFGFSDYEVTMLKEIS